eukprot:scaffold36494_cov22-Tisochrysis_lutea.AAC.1
MERPGLQEHLLWCELSRSPCALCCPVCTGAAACRGLCSWKMLLRVKGCPHLRGVMHSLHFAVMFAQAPLHIDTHEAPLHMGGFTLMRRPGSRGRTQRAEEHAIMVTTS